MSRLKPILTCLEVFGPIGSSTLRLAEAIAIGSYMFLHSDNSVYRSTSKCPAAPLHLQFTDTLLLFLCPVNELSRKELNLLLGEKR